jgi:hypothetical protein
MRLVASAASSRFPRNVRLPGPSSMSRSVPVRFRPEECLGRCQMATGIRRQILATVLALAVGWLAPVPVGAQSSETPRRGGVLLAAIAADAPSLDPHQENTFATLQPRSLVQPDAWVAVARRTHRIAAHGQCPLIREWHHRRAIDAAQFDGGLLDEPRAYPLLIAFPPAPTSRQTANT